MWNPDDFEGLDEASFQEIEQRIDQQMSYWEIQNLRGQAAIFHDDQHIGEQRKELHALKHPSVDRDALYSFRNTPVVDSLAGNMLIHPLTTPVIEVDETNTRARATWWSLGIEGLSKFQETPMAIVSIGMVPGVHIKEDGEWKILWGEWQRTTKNEYHAGWVDSMIPTNTRPALTPEQDRAGFGKYAYQKDEIRKAVPWPPTKESWKEYPDEMDASWQFCKGEKNES